MPWTVIAPLLLIPVPVILSNPATVVFPFVASTVNLPELTFKLPPKVDAPVTPSVPPIVVAPFPTVNAFPAAIVTSSFNVVVPVTVKVVSNDAASSTLNVPLIVVATPVAPISTPPAPSSVNAPEDVVKLEAPAASILIPPAASMVIPPVPASKSKAVAAVALPTVIVLAAEPVPILIAPALSSFPTLIAPPEELTSTFPVASISTVLAPDKDVAPVPPKTKDAVPSVIVKAFTDVIVMAVASKLANVLVEAPKARVPVPLGVIVILASLADVVISITLAAVISIPPAEAVNVNASFAVEALSITNPPVPASNSIVNAFTSTFVDASLPTVIVLAAAPEPILIAPVTASSPTFIAPALELICNAAVASIFKLASLTRSAAKAPLKTVKLPTAEPSAVVVPTVNLSALSSQPMNALILLPLSTNKPASFILLVPVVFLARVIILSLISTALEFTVVVVPVTVIFPVTVKFPPTVACVVVVTSPVTSNVPAIAVLPDAAVTTNLSVLIFVSPAASNVPAIVVLPLAAVTINLSVLTFVSPAALNVPAIVVLPEFAATINLLVLIFVVPVIFTASLRVVTPATSASSLTKSLFLIVESLSTISLAGTIQLPPRIPTCLLAPSPLAALVVGSRGVTSVSPVSTSTVKVHKEPSVA